MQGNYRILVVEDSDTQALRLQMLLEEQGWEAARVASAEEALESLGQGAPDLVVADHHLPGMTGAELCRNLRMNLNTCNIPVLMLTGAEGGEGELQGLDSGADDYVTKAEDPEVLLLRLQLLLAKARRREEPADRGGAPFRRTRLLVVDDSPTYREFLAIELGREGYEVDLAVDGEEGLAQAASGRYDCVLVDLVMPGLDGLEVCRRLLGRRAEEGEPFVVLLTGQEGKGHVAEGIGAGVDDFVGKSGDVAVLKGRLRALLRRRFYREQSRRIIEEYRSREMATLKALAEKEAAQAKASLAERLEEANRRLKEAQSQLVQSEKMSSLGQLVAGIAHEINNPLSFALNNVYTAGRNLERVAGSEEGLSERAAGRLDKARRQLADMKKGLDRVKDLVLKLRTFSRLDEGDFKSVDVHESIEAVLLFLKHKMGGGIRVERDFRAEGELACHAGPLNQVFMNLIANAVDSIDGEGTVTVSTYRESGFFKIEVRDTGAGIPAEARERIFDPFFTTKPVGQGTGLGLSVTYGIIQSHNGTIEVDAAEGGGTVFTVGIPADLDAPVRAAAVA